MKIVSKVIAIIDPIKPSHPKILPAVSREKQQQQLFNRFIMREFLSVGRVANRSRTCECVNEEIWWTSKIEIKRRENV